MTEIPNSGSALRPLAFFANSRQWIASPRFDLAFFILAPLTTLPIVFGTYARIPALAALGVVLAFPHYFSTLAFYFWDDNREYLRRRWLPFFGGPVMIAVTYAALVWWHVPRVLQCAIFFWNTWHVARQNCGILTIYRQRAGVTDVRQKKVANRAILFISSWFALWNVGSNADVMAFFASIHPQFGRVLFVALGVGAVLSCAHLAAALWRRAATEPPSLAELLFIGTSLTLFFPYLLIRDSGIATFVILLPHYVQYLGIVWLLHRRRFREDSGSPSQRVLGRISRSTPLLVGILTSIGFAFLAWFYLTKVSAPMVYENVYLLVAFEHFYLDGLVWAFRQPHVRKTLGPYLLAPAA
jgi:hypothetical protein